MENIVLTYFFILIIVMLPYLIIKSFCILSFICKYYFKIDKKIRCKTILKGTILIILSHIFCALFIALLLQIIKQTKLVSAINFENIVETIIKSPFDNIISLIVVTVSVLFCSIGSYFVNKKVIFSNIKQKFPCLMLTVLTTPYIYFVPLFPFAILLYLVGGFDGISLYG